ncbi:hypothetical protein M1L60_40660 [Actinoplanes sp. TRM 88003]|uniref:Uncharacterized protein n=1 Tax=Paractinoplanes aksuensis TaxID=2939490 RepID=A0ABT1E1C5_9ACTN|nr:hypothetical protein [Actinoplanes aksuensis]MCO8276912.1 hypothetical protein [Actinoplanes aksuensis]
MKVMIKALSSDLPGVAAGPAWCLGKDEIAELGVRIRSGMPYKGHYVLRAEGRPSGSST